MRVNQKMLVLWVVIPAVAMGLGCGCPLFPPSAGVLEGDWKTTDEDGNNSVVRFDEDGVVTGILTQNEDGDFVLILVDNATTELDDSAVTITVPTPLGSAIFIGTLSEDENTMTGELGKKIEIGDDLTVIIPEGELTLERITDICDLVTCEEGEVCEEGVCVDPCEDVVCDGTQTCEDGVCVPIDPCEDVVCDGTQICEDGVCVPIDPCEDVVCDGTQICVDGECVPIDPCEDVVCDGTQICVDGECVPIDPCEDVVCDGTQICVDGECVPIDPCEDVVCDGTQICVDGECVPLGDPVAGEAYYDENCALCHGDDATGGVGPSLIDATAEELMDKVDGTHGGVDAMTEQEALDLEAFLAS